MIALAFALLSESASDLGDELARVVDLPSPAARAAAVHELAQRRDADVPAWLAAMETFGRFDALVPGVSTERVELWIGGEASERTDLELYVPKAYDAARPAPLLVFLHGAGGSGAGLTSTWRPIAEALGLLVLAPSEAGSNAGYDYTDRERNSVLSAIRWARRRCNVDELRIFLAGASRGGHLAWDLALRHPHRFAALAPMTGGPRVELAGGRNNFRYLENLLELPIRDLQGAQDDPLLLANLRAAFARLARWKARDAELVLFPDLGHDFRMEAVDWRAFLGSARRESEPRRVLRSAARAGEGRAAWLEVLELERGVEEVFVPKLPKATYDALSAQERVEAVGKLVDERTGRVEAELAGPGKVKGKASRVTALRVLFTEAMLGDAREAKVEIGALRGRASAKPSAEVLLCEFVERFDRTFLPVVEVRAD
jgi:dienelactone hydrolase